MLVIDRQSIKGGTMYPVKIGYSGAVQRIRDLLKNGHYAEGLVTTAFTAEKTLRRTLRQLVVSAGFKSIISDKIIKGYRGLHAIKDGWELYDPCHRKLTEIISNADWKTIAEIAEIRNKLVHGERVYQLSLCHQKALEALTALDRIKDKMEEEYGFSGWEPFKIRRMSRLHEDPKVKIEKPS